MNKLNTDEFPAEAFRTPSNILLPDVRNIEFGDTGIEQFHQAIAKYELGSHVPEELVIQFDTARNLFLHAFYVYRFFPVAQHQLFVTLEQAIRECVGIVELENYRKNKNKQLPKGTGRFSRGLKLNLTYISEHNLIRNEDFKVWRDGRARKAEREYRFYVSKKMNEENISSYEWDEAEIDYAGVQYDYNYLDVLCETLPGSRNIMAHGSNCLHGGAVGDYEIVSVIINKIFERHRSS